MRGSPGSAIDGEYELLSVHPTKPLPAPPWADKHLMRQLVAGDYFEHKLNILVTGPTGVGKTWLACALAHKACRDGYSVRYLRLPRLGQDLPIAKADGRYPKLLRGYAKADLIVLDDWGLMRSSPASARSSNGTSTSASQPWPTRSSIASSTTPTSSPHAENQCEKPIPA